MPAPPSAAGAQLQVGGRARRPATPCGLEAGEALRPVEGKPPALVPSYLVAGTRETETPTSQARVPRGPAQDAEGSCREADCSAARGWSRRFW